MCISIYKYFEMIKIGWNSLGMLWTQLFPINLQVSSFALHTSDQMLFVFKSWDPLYCRNYLTSGIFEHKSNFLKRETFLYSL